MKQPMGDDCLFVDKTVVDEWGLFKLTDSHTACLLFSWKRKEDAVEIGEKVAKVLNLKFHKHRGSLRVDSALRR